MIKQLQNPNNIKKQRITENSWPKTNLIPNIDVENTDVIPFPTGPPSNGVDNAANGNLGTDNPGLYENLPFHGLQQPPNKVTLVIIVYRNDDKNGNDLKLDIMK